jgi:hypothetical protein
VRTPARRTQRMPNSAARNSWNGARNVYSNVPGYYTPSSENECRFLGKTEIPVGPKNDWILAIFVWFR